MKKLGKAKIDLEKDLWTTDREMDYFLMNRRIVETRSDVKKFMAKYKKGLNAAKPSRRQPLKREEYFRGIKELRRQHAIFWTRIYKDVIEESFQYPIPLRKNNDYDHTREWRYCMYKGVIYQFDKQGLSDHAMLEAIYRLEGWDQEPPENDSKTTAE